MTIPRSALKRFLAQLGLVTLTASGLSTPALAHFSPIDQPLESQWFIGAKSDVAMIFEALPEKIIGGGAGVKSVFVGGNLLKQDNLVAGIVGNFARVDFIRQAMTDKVLIQQFTHVANLASLGGYVAYKSNQDEITGLRLGSALHYVGVFGEDNLGASKTVHAIAALANQSYGLELTKLAEYPLTLTQSADAYAVKVFHDNVPTVFGLTGSLKLALDVEGFSPFVSANIVRPVTGDEKTDQALPSVGTGFAWKTGNHAVVKFDLAMSKVSEEIVAKCGIGLDLLF